MHMYNKIISADEAANVINSHQKIGIQSFIMTGCPEEILQSIEKRFLETGKPNNLSVFFASGIGDFATKGLNHLAYENLLDTVIGSHWFVSPKISELITNNKAKGYNIPQGIAVQLLRAEAAKQPGVFTNIGLNTYIDPRIEGGKMNERTIEEIVEVVEFENQEWLRYQLPFDMDLAIIRGTTADEYGNITCEEEAIKLGIVSLAQAVKNNDGKVIVQVKRIAKNNTLPASKVVVPGMLVDYIVVAEEENHHQTMSYKHNPSFSGEIRSPIKKSEKDTTEIRKFICEKAAENIKENNKLAFGIGISEGVGEVAEKKGLLSNNISIIESGHIGGIPAYGGDFGCSWNPQAIIETADMFGYIQGGGVDQAFLGMAQVDEVGNVNVTKFGNRIAGCGGFVDITQSAKEIYFCGTFKSKNLNISFNNGKITINNDGEISKFVKKVHQISFSVEYALRNNQKVFYITERAVFKLTEEGLKLISVTPGVDIH